MESFDYSEYEKSLHRDGRIMNAIGIALLFSIPSFSLLFLVHTLSGRDIYQEY